MASENQIKMALLDGPWIMAEVDHIELKLITIYMGSNSSLIVYFCFFFSKITPIFQNMQNTKDSDGDCITSMKVDSRV